MASDNVYNTCMRATDGDKHYCKQILNTLSKLSRERAVAYRGERGVKHIVVLPDDDMPVVDVVAGKDRNLIVRIQSKRYAALVRYVYDGEFKPMHAVISNLEYVNMLNMHLSFTDIITEIFKRGEGYDQ